jgi:hypothetical protein
MSKQKERRKNILMFTGVPCGNTAGTLKGEK